MNLHSLKSMDDIKNFLGESNFENLNNEKNKIDIKKSIYREFKKKDNKFVATDNFFLSREVDKDIIEFNNLNKLDEENFISYHNNNIFISSINSLKCYKMIIISNISFNLNETKINTIELIQKYINNDILIDNDILEELYFNNVFSKKIDIELPTKYNKNCMIEDINMNTKFLFKIDNYELNSYYSIENNFISN